jgi:hypothetical protein
MTFNFGNSFLLGIEIFIIFERAKGLFYFFLCLDSLANKVSLAFIILNDRGFTFMCCTLCRKREEYGVRERSVAEWL